MAWLAAGLKIHSCDTPLVQADLRPSIQALAAAFEMSSLNWGRQVRCRMRVPVEFSA
jgi:hypothetical protein